MSSQLEAVFLPLFSYKGTGYSPCKGDTYNSGL